MTATPITTALQALLERVEAGEFPADTSARDLGIVSDGLPIIKTIYAAFSGSLDAAKALHEAVLPGWHWSLYDDNGIGIYEAQIEVHDWQGEPISGASKCNPARAWLIAILRALIATPANTEGR